MSTIDPGSGTAVITVETPEDVVLVVDKSSHPYRKRVRTVHRGSGYSRVVLAHKRTVPDYVKCPHNSTYRINQTKPSRQWTECVESYSAINRRYACTTCAEIGIRPGPVLAMVGLMTEAILLAVGTLLGATRKTNSPTFCPTGPSALPVSV